MRGLHSSRECVNQTLTHTGDDLGGCRDTEHLLNPAQGVMTYPIILVRNPNTALVRYCLFIPIHYPDKLK